MSLFNKPLESIKERDLQELLDNKVSEIRKTIEYKRSLPGNSDREKKEFLFDVSSFANTIGGDLIYGIKEKQGVPVEVCGLQGYDPDKEILRLESIIRSGIAPRIYGVSSQPIPLEASGVVIIIRTPRSYALPHMVTFKGCSKFYSRNSGGKHPLDVSELRRLFALSETTAERIRVFRLERLGKIVSGETPVLLEKVPKIVLHIIPFGAFDPAAIFDVASLASDCSRLMPVYTAISGHRHNFDGFLTYNQSGKSSLANSYVQIFRNGIIETVDAHILRPRLNMEKSIPSSHFKEKLLLALPRYLSIQKQLGIEPPFFIMLSLLGVSGYVMAVHPSLAEDLHPIDRDDLLVPEVVVEKFDCDPDKIMKPAFDAVSNACGLPGSMNYDESENRIKQQ